MRRARVRAVTALAAIALGVTATSCGDDGDDEVSAGNGDAAETTNEAETEDTADTADDASPERPEVLRVAVAAGSGDADLAESMSALNDAYSEATGLPVEVVEVADSNGIIESLRAGRVDIATLSGFLLVFGQQLADLEVVAAAAGSTDVSAIVVREDSDIQSIEDLTGRSIALGDPNSAGSGIQPRLQLLDAGIDPDADMEVTYTGAYDAALLSVINGAVDAAGTRPFVMEMLAENADFDTDELRIIETSDPLPLMLAVVATDTVPDDVIEDLRTYMLSDDGLEALQALSPLADSTFVPDDEVYSYFQNGIDSLGIQVEDLE